MSGCCRSTPTIRAGGRVFIWPMFHRLQRLSLNTMTIEVSSPAVHSEGGVPVTVKGVAQVKIQGKDLASLRAASEMFLDKSESEIMDIAKATLDGHQRSMIASKKIESIYTERHEFSRSVQQSAQTDLIDMGLTLVSYTVQDISDSEGYLDAVGHKNTSAVTSDSRKEVAKANTFSAMRKLDLDLTKEQEELKFQHSLALKQMDFEIAKATYDKDVQENQARQEKGGEIRAAEVNKLIAKEKLEVLLMQKERDTELMVKKRELKMLELDNEKERTADFECERQKALASAHEQRAKLEADQKAEQMLRLATARAESIRLEKQAEAEVLQQRAQAFMQFGNAAKLEMVLAILPRLTAEIAGPLNECKKITSVSQDGSVGFTRITSEIMEVVEKICESVSNISGHPLTASSNGNDDDNDRPGSSIKRKVSSNFLDR